MAHKKFKFHMPLSLTKADGEEAEWRVQGIASTEDPDLQGETVLQDGLDISALRAGRGLFNWDHHKGPENILGAIEDAEFVDHEGRKALMVKGYLFKNQDRAKAFYNILKSLKKGSSPRVHMSIEGKILERDFSDQKRIRKARIDKVALTMDPVNPNTFTSLVKSLAAEELQDNEAVRTVEDMDETIEISKAQLTALIDAATKALTAGTDSHKLYVKANQDTEVKMTSNESMAQKMKKEHEKIEDRITTSPGEVGVEDQTSKALAAGAGAEKAPESASSGEAMSKESLEKEPKIVTHGQSKKKCRKTMLKSVIDDLSKSFPEVSPLDLTEWVLEMFIDKLDSKENK